MSKAVKKVRITSESMKKALGKYFQFYKYYDVEEFLEKLQVAMQRERNRRIVGAMRRIALYIKEGSYRGVRLTKGKPKKKKKDCKALLKRLLKSYCAICEKNCKLKKIIKEVLSNGSHN